MVSGEFDEDFAASQPEAGLEAISTPRTRSLRSWRSRSSLRRSRSNSRPSSPDTHLHRIYSAAFHDDHGTYIDAADLAANEQPLQRAGSDASESVSKDEAHDDGDKEKGLEEVESHEDDHESIKSKHSDRAGQNGDLEKVAPTLSRQQTSKSTRSKRDRDPNMVSWSGPDDPENPKNWKDSRKWAAVFVVSSFTFISPVASAMVAPALPQMNQDLGVHNQTISAMMLSIFLLAYAVGPLFLGPLSEVYGRVPVLQLANLVFLIFNLVCGFAQNAAQMLVFRFLAGIGGSAPLAIGGGILADCFQPEQRGKAIAIYSLAPLVCTDSPWMTVDS